MKTEWIRLASGRGEHVHRLGGGRLGFGFGVGVGVGGDLFGDCASVFGDGDGEAVRRTLQVR